MDILVYDGLSKDYQICSYNTTISGTQCTWEISEHYQDYIHPSELDPGEKYQFRVNTHGFFSRLVPDYYR